MSSFEKKLNWIDDDIDTYTDFNELDIILIKTKEILEFHSIIIIEIAKKQADNILIRFDEKNRMNYIELFVNKIDEFTKTIDKSRNNFFNILSNQIKSIHKFTQYPELVYNYNQLIKDEKKMYFSFTKTLMSEFKINLEEKNYPINIGINSELPEKQIIEYVEQVINDITFEIKYINNQILEMDNYFNSKNK